MNRSVGSVVRAAIGVVIVLGVLLVWQGCTALQASRDEYDPNALSGSERVAGQTAQLEQGCEATVQDQLQNSADFSNWRLTFNAASSTAKAHVVVSTGAAAGDEYEAVCASEGNLTEVTLNSLEATN